jgi:hypothetical protein
LIHLEFLDIDNKKHSFFNVVYQSIVVKKNKNAAVRINL